MKPTFAADRATLGQNLRGAEEGNRKKIEIAKVEGLDRHAESDLYATAAAPHRISLCPAAIPSSIPAQSTLAPTIFHEEWWLDAATMGRYAIAEVSANGRTVGRLPYVLRRRFGLQGVWTPPMTYFLGPAVDEGAGSPNCRFLRKLEITRELIQKLPQASWQCVRCHRGVTDVIAFQELAFRTYVQFTNELEPRPAKNLWSQLRNKTRNVIRRAQEQFDVVECLDIDEFIYSYVKNLDARRVQNTLDLSACRRLLQAAQERSRGRIVTARNAKNEMVAANFCAWDAGASFYIACTRNAAAGNGATSLLLWDSIQHAARRNLIFDFAGIGNRGSILHYAGFGAAIAPRYVAVRATGFGRLTNAVRSLFTESHFLF